MAWGLLKPVSMPALTLRDYQKELCRKAYTSTDHICVQASTGAGKTPCIAALCYAYVKDKKRVLVLAHREELIRQCYQKLGLYDIVPGIIMSGINPVYGEPVQVGSIQTVTRRLDALRNVDVIIVDEAHHSTATSYLSIFDHYPDAKRIGFTATPNRGDGKGLHSVYDELVCGPTTQWLIDKGYLVRSECYAMALEFDLKDIGKSRGDYNVEQLSTRMNTAPMVNDLVVTYQMYGQEKPCIVFAVNVAHGKAIQEAYVAHGITCAILDGKTPSDIREKTLAQFRNGTYQVLVNVMLFTEGFDMPDVGVVQLARPTQSLPLYLQMVGRGLRKTQDKDYCIILDHAHCITTFGFPEQEREWDLEDKPKKAKESLDIDMLDPEDETAEAIPLEQEDYEEQKYWPGVVRLVPMGKDNLNKKYSRVKVIEELVRRQQSNGYKPYWSYMQYLNTYKKPTREDLSFWCDYLGYNRGWIKHESEKFGLVASLNR